MEVRDLPPALTVAEAARLLRVSEKSAREAIHRNEIPHIRIGHRIIVPAAKLLALLGVEPVSDPTSRESDVVVPHKNHEEPDAR